jgi:hypothetical protein
MSALADCNSDGSTICGTRPRDAGMNKAFAAPLTAESATSGAIGGVPEMNSAATAAVSPNGTFGWQRVHPMAPSGGTTFGGNRLRGNHLRGEPASGAPRLRTCRARSVSSQSRHLLRELARGPPDVELPQLNSGE